MATFTIDEKDFFAGESQSDLLHDHGFSPSSNGLNFLKTLGAWYAGYQNTDRGGATLSGNPMAYTYDKNSLGNDMYIVDDGGAFYTLNGGTFTKRQTVTADTPVLGTTDILQFQGNTYCTMQTRIIQLTASNLTGVDSSWWTGLNTAVRHPLEVVEDKMYIGDLNLIHTWDGTTSVGSAITLPTDANITSLRRHPDGRHLIAFCGYTQDYSHQKGGPGKIYIINKDTKQWEREIQIETQVEGSRNVGGVIYVTYGKKLGYFTGNGIRFLKRLATSGTTYSHSMGNMEDLLLVRDGTNLLMFGDLNGSGHKSWHNFYQGSNTINIVGYKGNQLIMVGDGAATLKELDYTSSSSSGQFYSKRYNFGTPVKVRRIDVIHDQPGSGTLAFNLNFIDESSTSNLIEAVSYSASATPNITTTRVKCDITADIFQLNVVPQNGGLGIKLIRVYYDPIHSDQ